MRIIQLLYDEVSRREFSYSQCFQNKLHFFILQDRISLRIREKTCRRKKNDLYLNLGCKKIRSENVIRLYSHIRK